MRWQPFDHIVFDFDSTLTTIEGVDVLAARAAAADSVAALTEKAMAGSLPLEEVYAERLKAIHPTRAAVRELREVYKKHLTEDAAALIGALQALGHQVYIVSGGLIDPIAEVAVSLGVPRGHVQAVDVEYDELAGEWWAGGGTAEQFRRSAYRAPRRSALQTSTGKDEVIRSLLAGKRGRRLLIGDGVTDLMASSAVDLFLAYAGTVARSRVIDEAPVTLRSASLAPVLLLAAGRSAETRVREPAHRALLDKATHLVGEGALAFRDASLGERFARACARPAGNAG